MGNDTTCDIFFLKKACPLNTLNILEIHMKSDSCVTFVELYFLKEKKSRKSQLKFLYTMQMKKCQLSWIWLTNPIWEPCTGAVEVTRSSRALLQTPACRGIGLPTFSRFPQCKSCCIFYMWVDETSLQLFSVCFLVPCYQLTCSHLYLPIVSPIFLLFVVFHT